MPTFPLTFPPLVNGFEESFEDAVLRSEYEAGYEQTRARYTRLRRRFKCVYRISNAQKNTLDNFYVVNLKNGAFAFTWTHPVSGSNISVRYANPPTYKPLPNNYWYCTMELSEV